MFKKIALAALVAASLGTSVSAAATSSYFTLHGDVEPTLDVNLGTIVSTGAGVVELYSYHAGAQGDLLGTAQIDAGANADVNVHLATMLGTDALAVLKVDGEVVATSIYDIER